ncbi:ankyrin repeat-containing domain protein [Morchella snyderi]|nr:ankyrin repeat-containing domain protein [Morchella snyderi]
MSSLAESLTSKPGNSVGAAIPASLSDMPQDIILQIADRTDIGTLSSLSRVCKGFSVLLQCHRDKDTELLRAVERRDLRDIKRVLQSPLATARGGLGLLAKVVEDYQKVLHLAFERWHDVEALTECCREQLSRTVALVRLLFEAGAEIDGCDTMGFTALHWAVKCYDTCGSDVNLVKLLVELGADVNNIGTIGVTPLHSAVNGFCTLALAQALLEAGANVHCKDKYGLTPLHVAALQIMGTRVFDILESAGAVIDTEGYPLSPMCSRGCFHHYHDSSCEIPYEDRLDLVHTSDRYRHLPAYSSIQFM